MWIIGSWCYEIGNDMVLGVEFEYDGFGFDGICWCIEEVYGMFEV